jgi:MarR family transcriptional regulator, transcriptional regulator for hemolysin
MDGDELITRRRDPANRRVHLVELTEAGETAFTRLRNAAVGFDRRHRRGIPEAEIQGLQGLLDRLAVNAGAQPDHRGPPGAGLLRDRQ